MPGPTRSFDLARRLVAKGHQIDMITSERSVEQMQDSQWRITDEAGITVHWVQVPYSNKMSFWARMKAFFRFAIRSAVKASSIEGDVIFATSTPLTIALPAIYASKRSRIPMVFEVRDLWPEVPIVLGIIKNPLSKWAARTLENSAYRHSSHIVALAPGMKEEIVSHGYPEAQITVIPNGCDIELYADCGQAASRLRRTYEWLGDRPLVVYAGALGQVNAVDYLVDIAHCVKAIDPNIRFAVVGTGVEAENIERRARDKGVYDQTFFMIGQVPKRTAAVWMSAATITVALVRGPRFIWKDATQNKYFDSLAAGTPVASNYDGWQAEVASAAGAGVILDYERADKAARRLVALVNDKEWLAGAAAIALQLATGEYSRDKQADNLERVLKDVIAG